MTVQLLLEVDMGIPATESVAEMSLEETPPRPRGKKDKNLSAKKTALKKIVANMTMSNNDMVALFPDIVGCMHIPSLEIKKMYVRRGCVERGASPH